MTEVRRKGWLEQEGGLSEARPSQAKQAAERCTLHINSTQNHFCLHSAAARIDMPALATPAARHQAIATKQVSSLSWHVFEPSDFEPGDCHKTGDIFVLHSKT